MDEAALRSSIESFGGVLFVGLLAYLILELAALHFRRRKLRVREARAAGLGMVATIGFQMFLTAVVGTLSVAVAAFAGAALSPVEASLALPWWVVGLVVYEFWYWVQHWAAHKVRLLWCIHAPHHGPESIHILVGTNHHFLEGAVYFPLFLGFLPAVCGVHPVICIAINLIDGIWGSLLHISDEMVPNGRYGWLGRVLQTPAYHRVHHGKNPRYMDMNYNSITLFWDWLLGTLQPLRDDEPVRYGITREFDTGSYWQLHFGEFASLWRDLRSTPRLRNRLALLVMAPGWSPDGRGHTVADVKRTLAAEDLARREAA